MSWPRRAASPERAEWYRQATLESMTELGWSRELLAQAMLYMHGELDLSPTEMAVMEEIFERFETALEAALYGARPPTQ